MISSTPTRQGQILVFNQRDQNELGSSNPFEFKSEIRSSEELRMQLETNKSIKYCVLLDI